MFFLYADDLLLVSQSFSSMQTMLNICNDMVSNLDLKFNVTKSMFLSIGLRFRIPTADLILDGQKLCKADELKYLGVHIKAGKCWRCTYDHCKLKCYRSFNAIFHRSISASSELVTVQLLKSFCIPLVLYALEVINCSKSELLALDRLIFTALCKIFKTYDKDTIDAIRAHCGLDTVDVIVSRRFANFYKAFALKNLEFTTVILNINGSLVDRLDRLYDIG